MNKSIKTAFGPSPAENGIIRLTGRETALGMMLARRLRHKEIAARFDTTPAAIAHRVQDLFKVFNVHSLNEFIGVWNERPGVEKGILWGDLPTRQIQIGTLLLQGMKRDEIAAELNISPRTVGTHLCYMYEKFGIAGRDSEKMLVEKLCEFLGGVEADGESENKITKEQNLPCMDVSLV